ncbi:ATP-binding protein [Mesorhizobium sp. M1405]|uniref:sensor histidine kinase n=1 Tax=unclassified Mesorhizobium TaxID=325217 RepID=UPI0033396634
MQGHQGSINEYKGIPIKIVRICFGTAAALVCACALLNFGPVLDIAAGAMILKRFFNSTTGLYVALAMALSLGCWSFVLSEHYRQETGRSLGQTFETLRMAEETRVGIVRIAGWLRLASETRELEPAFGRQITLIIANIDRLLTLEQLSQKEIDLLLKAREVIKTQVMPIALIGRGYDDALRRTDEIEQNMSEIGRLAAAHRISVKEKAKIAIAATRNRFVFALALVMVVIGFIIIAQRAEFSMRRDEYIRAFSLLHAHMTRSRIVALRLFLGYLGDQTPPSPEMFKAAQDAAKELEDITNGLMRIANSGRDLRTEPLGKLLQENRSALDTHIRLEIDDNAKELQVPATQVRLIVEELVNNATKAVRGRQDKQVTIGARLLNRRFLFARRLLIKISDNGGGMTSDIRDKAATPFFSTQGGAHVGLGLTGCIEMVNAMRGSVRITSTPGVGTIVRIVLPIDTGRMAVI